MKSVITYEDFDRIEMRVGKVLEASSPEWSKKLLEFHVDFGGDIGIKTIFSGIKAWYEPEFFIGKNFPFVINLAERKMGEGISQGMMIMADSSEKPIVMPLEDSIEIGAVIR